jgi:hypothetical protein
VGTKDLDPFAQRFDPDTQNALQVLQAVALGKQHDALNALGDTSVALLFVAGLKLFDLGFGQMERLWLFAHGIYTPRFESEHTTSRCRVQDLEILSCV